MIKRSKGKDMSCSYMLFGILNNRAQANGTSKLVQREYKIKHLFDHKKEFII